MESINFKQYSIAKGLIIPEIKPEYLIGKAMIHECSAGCAMKLASQPHRWDEVNKLAKETFNKYMDIVEEHEKKLLDVLGLPNINTVRIEATKGTTDPYVPPANASAAVSTILTDWANDVVGSEEVYQNSQLQAFGIGLSKTQKAILRVAPKDRIDEIRANTVFASYGNPRLQAIVRDGSTRIIKDITVGKKKLIERILADGIINNSTPMQVASRLHKMVGEGDAWQWLRFARSEITLAMEAAYDVQADAQGIKYDQWSAAGNACEICSPLDGDVWKRGEGPIPVADTHPNCYCIRIPLFEYDKVVQNIWTEPSPYLQAA